MKKFLFIVDELFLSKINFSTKITYFEKVFLSKSFKSFYEI